MASGMGRGMGKNSVFIQELATESLIILQWVYGQHELNFVFFFNFYFLLLFFCGGHKGRGVNLERLERKCVQEALWESTKQSIKRLLGRKRKPTLVFRWLVDWEEEGPWGMPNQKRKGQGSLYRRGSTKTEALELCELIISGSNPSFCF